MFANLSLEHGVLKDINQKTLQVAEKRELARYAIAEFGLSERQTCRAVKQRRCAHRCQAKRTTDEPIVQELRQLANLNVIDDDNREALWIEVDTSLPKERVVRVLDKWLYSDPREFVRI